MATKIESNIPLTRLGRRDNPPKKGWKDKYKSFKSTKNKNKT